MPVFDFSPETNIYTKKKKSVVTTTDISLISILLSLIVIVILIHFSDPNPKQPGPAPPEIISLTCDTSKLIYPNLQTLRTAVEQCSNDPSNFKTTLICDQNSPQHCYRWKEFVDLEIDILTKLSDKTSFVTSGMIYHTNTSGTNIPPPCNIVAKLNTGDIVFLLFPEITRKNKRTGKTTVAFPLFTPSQTLAFATPLDVSVKHRTSLLENQWETSLFTKTDVLSILLGLADDHIVLVDANE